MGVEFDKHNFEAGHILTAQDMNDIDNALYKVCKSEYNQGAGINIVETSTTTDNAPAYEFSVDYNQVQQKLSALEDGGVIITGGGEDLPQISVNTNLIQSRLTTTGGLDIDEYSNISVKVGDKLYIDEDTGEINAAITGTDDGEGNLTSLTIGEDFYKIPQYSEGDGISFSDENVISSKISQQAGNALTISEQDQGLYCAPGGGVEYIPGNGIMISGQDNSINVMPDMSLKCTQDGAFNYLGVKLSWDADNGLEVRNNGLYCGGASYSEGDGIQIENGEISVRTDSKSFDYDSQENLKIKLSPQADNALSLTADGLYCSSGGGGGGGTTVIANPYAPEDSEYDGLTDLKSISIGGSSYKTSEKSKSEIINFPQFLYYDSDNNIAADYTSQRSDEYLLALSRSAEKGDYVQSEEYISNGIAVYYYIDETAAQGSWVNTLQFFSYALQNDLTIIGYYSLAYRGEPGGRVTHVGADCSFTIHTLGSQTDGSDTIITLKSYQSSWADSCLEDGEYLLSDLLYYQGESPSDFTTWEDVIKMPCFDDITYYGVISYPSEDYKNHFISYLVTEGKQEENIKDLCSFSCDYLSYPDPLTGYYYVKGDSITTEEGPSSILRYYGNSTCIGIYIPEDFTSEEEYVYIQDIGLLRVEDLVPGTVMFAADLESPHLTGDPLEEEYYTRPQVAFFQFEGWDQIQITKSSYEGDPDYGLPMCREVFIDGMKYRPYVGDGLHIYNEYDDPYYDNDILSIKLSEESDNALTFDDEGALYCPSGGGGGSNCTMYEVVLSNLEYDLDGESPPCRGIGVQICVPNSYPYEIETIADLAAYMKDMHGSGSGYTYPWHAIDSDYSPYPIPIELFYDNWGSYIGIRWGSFSNGTFTVKDVHITGADIAKNTTF